MIGTGLNGTRGNCEQTHRRVTLRLGRVTRYLRQFLIAGGCLWIPVIPAEHLQLPIPSPPVTLTESRPAYPSEPLVGGAALTDASAPVAHPGVPQPFSDTFRLFLRVKPGETLSAIGKRYGVTVQALVHHNWLQNPDHIKAGNWLVIPMSGLPLIWPVAGMVSSEFGPRGHRFHKGIDIAAPRGTPVRAAADGRVIISGIQRGYGRVIWVRHVGGYLTVYAHHEVNQVTAGQWVRQGQEIAQVGISGRTTGPHLHFEVHVPGAAQDPLLYLPPDPPVQAWIRDSFASRHSLL